tara:strand:- start:92 stop:310 length:219 start_codon:yes stop_codon:yes gene_type:complete
MKKKKLFLTISLAWIILIGYLVWANGLMNEGSKKFKWDEWIWFGIIPAISPYFFYFIWHPEEFKNLLKNDKH